jgi:hypothetical protein
MVDARHETAHKPATAARIYDYHLGGTHNFPADRAAAQAITERFPVTPALARLNRAFLRRTLRYLVSAGVRQFLDIGSGIPTEGNVHEVVQDLAAETRVVYVDIDPVAVAESQELLEGNERAIAIRGDVRSPQPILAHPQVRRLLDFDQPIGLLLCAILHFVADDDDAHGAVADLLAALPSGSYLVISHAAPEDPELDDIDVIHDVYKRHTATPVTLRTRSEMARFFTGLDLVEPGLVWLPEWRPDPADPVDFAEDPKRCHGLGAVGRVR